MFGQWRGGRRLVRNLELELYQDFERQVLDDETRIIQGLGEGGDAVELDVNHLAEASLKEYGVNVYLSDHIAYNRTLRDYRNPACAQVVYDTELPSASVIIIFHNEPYSTLIRTVWSVINNDRNNTWFSAASRGIAQNYTSMSAYLKEIILVDDKSTLSELKGKLDYYMRTRLPPDLIRIVRLTQRVGLIRARVAGARVAVGDVLVFLDAHCEGQPDWLRPMLQRIKDSPRSVIAPISDFIVSTTLRYAVKEPVTSFEVGGFLFLAPFVWIQLSDREIERRASDIAPTRLVFYKRTATALLVCKLGTYRTRLYRLIYVKYILNVKRSPTMAGGLFAMYRSYFWQLGAYDEQMVHWGGENLEMSFRIWQCGGTLEIIPCSRVGHVIRSLPPSRSLSDLDSLGINTARMANVWMDDYAEIFYLNFPELRKDPRVGDVTHRRKLREKLKCKSFQWYLDNVYTQKFIPVQNVFGFGRFVNPSSELCLDLALCRIDGCHLGVYPCYEVVRTSQFLSLTLSGELRDETECAEVDLRRNSDVESRYDGNRVIMRDCKKKNQRQKWRYLATRQIQHVKSKMCLDADRPAGDRVLVRHCQPNLTSQRWIIDYSEDNEFDMLGGVEPTDQEIKLQRLIERRKANDDANRK